MTRSPRNLVPIAIAVVVLLAIGVYAGMRSPWGVRHAQVKQGVALRAGSDLVLFDAEDGTQLSFRANQIWWHSASRNGEADPPCLRKKAVKVDVEVGYMRVAGPDGGWQEQAVWVKCL